MTRSLAILVVVSSLLAAAARSSAAEDGQIAVILPPDMAEIDRTTDDLTCLALAVYWEGRGEGEQAQRAIAHAALNRVGDARFGPTVCAVVKQENGKGCQFSWWCDHKDDAPKDAEAWQQSLRVAAEAMRRPDADPTGGAQYFHHVDVKPDWAAKGRDPRVIGEHVFLSLPEG